MNNFYASAACDPLNLEHTRINPQGITQEPACWLQKMSVNELRKHLLHLLVKPSLMTDTKNKTRNKSRLLIAKLTFDNSEEMEC